MNWMMKFISHDFIFSGDLQFPHQPNNPLESYYNFILLKFINCLEEETFYYSSSFTIYLYYLILFINFFIYEFL